IGPGDVITLSGDLGAGKTAAARAMIRYLADDDAVEVPSPTFTLTQAYDVPPFPLLHADLYRINDPAELEEIGLSPLPEGMVALIEWPERAAGVLPPDRIDIALSHRAALGSTARPAQITGRGFSAPSIHHADLDSGFLISEDFGVAGLVEGDPPAPIAERYEAATDLLAALHRQALPETLPLSPQLTYAIPTFDTDALLIEIGLMLEWYLPDRGAELTETMRAEFITMWRDLLSKPAAAAKTWLLRDFHSPNLIWLGERSDIARVGIIDFQDAVLGPPAYDLVSLLQDARVDVPEQLELALLTRYIK